MNLVMIDVINSIVITAARRPHADSEISQNSGGSPLRPDHQQPHDRGEQRDDDQWSKRWR
jgi:hypothetical protein